MRSLARRALTVGTIAATVLAWSGCDAKKQTEYVAGISTQVIVPRDMKAIVVSVSVGGIPQFCRAYRVYDGRVQLPRSLGEFPSAGKPGPDPITVTVVGFTEELSENSANPVFADCVYNAATVGKNGARVLRRSRQPYVADEVLFLPMPLKFSCFDVDCKDDGSTCRAGRCATAAIDEKTLPRFSEDMIDGTGGACFAASGCFAAAVPAVVVDPGDCTYALPNTASAPALAPGTPADPILGCPPDVPGQPHIPCDGINVEITYDGGYTREILDKENDEGFSVPDLAKPQRFRLAPGLCDLVKGETQDGTPTAHRITAVRATGLCRAKGPFQPLCANDQLGAMGTPLGVSGTPKTPDACKPQELKPAQSVLTILADDTDNNAIFYKGSGGGTGSGALANSGLVTKALEDPAFENTLIGLTLFPGRAGASCGPHDPEFPPALKKSSQPAIAAKFVLLAAQGALKQKDTDLKLSSALDDAYKALQSSYPTANKRAVLVISNRGFDTNSCSAALGLPAARALAAHNSNTAMEPPVDTYVALLARDRFVTDSDPPPVVPDAQAVAEAGASPGSGAHVFDGRKDKNQAIDALRKIVDELATCAYGSTEKPVADPGVTSVLTYSDPVAIPGPQPTFHTIPHDAACTGNGAAGNGWGYDSVKKRVYVCGAACQTYRDTLRTAAAYAAQYSQPSLPVPMFAHKAECAPK